MSTEYKKIFSLIKNFKFKGENDLEPMFVIPELEDSNSCFDENNIDKFEQSNFINKTNKKFVLNLNFFK